MFNLFDKFLGRNEWIRFLLAFLFHYVMYELKYLRKISCMDRFNFPLL